MARDNVGGGGAEDGGLTVHQATYHNFMLGVKWFALHLVALMVWLILWFATPAGFLWGLVAGLAVFAAGVYAMNHGLTHSSERDNLQAH